MKLHDLSRRVPANLLHIAGWTFLGISIFSSFTLLPMALILSFLESKGPIGSGDQGLQTLLIPAFCLLPGTIGFALLLSKKFMEKQPSKKLVLRCVILFAVQLACTGLVTTLTPCVGSSYDGSCDH
jgi:hypothetical protein